VTQLGTDNQPTPLAIGPCSPNSNTKVLSDRGEDKDELVAEDISEHEAEETLEKHLRE